MKTHDNGAFAAQRQPADRANEREPIRSTHSEAETRHGAQLRAIDKSPRMVAQRRALQIAFGRAFQRQADGVEDDAQGATAVQRVPDAAEASVSTTVVAQCIGPLALRLLFNKHGVLPAEFFATSDAIARALRKDIVDVTQEEAESYLSGEHVDETANWEKQFNDKTCWLATIAAASDQKLSVLKARLETEFHWKDEDFFSVALNDIAEMCAMLKIECHKVDIEQDSFDQSLQIGCKVTILVPGHVMLVSGAEGEAGSADRRYSVWDPANGSIQHPRWAQLSEDVLHAFTIF